MPNQYFKDKKILITGRTGFVGSNLGNTLQKLGARVFDTSNINILHLHSLEQIVKNNAVSHCVHLAGKTLVESGSKDPYITFKTNIEGTLNVLEIARKYALEKVIIASSSHVYGKNRTPYFEGYTTRPSRPYETSKACADLMAQSYADTFNIPVLISRFVNIYGPHDSNTSRLIPKTILSVIKGSDPVMWGNGTIVRDYLYIDDAIHAYLRLLEADINSIKGNRVFNFGSGSLVSVYDMISTIISLSGTNCRIRRMDQSTRPHEIHKQYVSSNKAYKQLHWAPTVSLNTGLKKTIAWYRKYYEQKT